MEREWINTDYRLVGKADDLRRALGYYRGETKTLPIVAEKQRAYGLVDVRKILDRGVRRSTKIEKVALRVPCLAEDTEIDAVIEALGSTLTGILPVASTQNEKVIGYVDAVRTLGSLDADLSPAQAASHAPRVMVDANIQDAIRVFQESSMAQLPVIDDGYIAGIIHRSDLVRLAELESTSIGRQDVAGEQTDVRDQSVESITEGGWIDSRADAGFDAIRSTIEKEGYAFLTSGGRYVGCLDASRLIKATQKVTEDALYGTATPHYRRQSNL